MPNLSVKLTSDLVEYIDKDIQRLGYNISRNGWIVQACMEKKESTQHNIDMILRKLRGWDRSFPKKPFKEVISEIENGTV